MKTDIKRLPLRPLKRSISVEIAVLVRYRILNGTCAAGAQFLQDSVAAGFGVGKIAVREALVQLDALGLVDSHANRDFQVRSMSTGEAEEVFCIRLMIESAVCAQGARCARHEDRLEAEGALDVLIRPLAGRKMETAGESSRNFHILLTVPDCSPSRPKSSAVCWRFRIVLCTRTSSRPAVLRWRSMSTRRFSACGRSGRRKTWSALRVSMSNRQETIRWAAQSRRLSAVWVAPSGGEPWRPASDVRCRGRAQLIRYKKKSYRRR